MTCSICKNEIEKQYTPDGRMYWDQGHNADPVTEGRCCGQCNATVVIPIRLQLMQRRRDSLKGGTRAITFKGVKR